MLTTGVRFLVTVFVLISSTLVLSEPVANDSHWPLLLNQNASFSALNSITEPSNTDSVYELNIARAMAAIMVFYDMVNDFSHRYPPAAGDKLTDETSLIEWPAIEMNLDKGSLNQLIDSKSLCGSVVYSCRCLASVVTSEQESGLRTMMAIGLLMPACYQANENFDYAKANLPTILTIFTIIASTRLLDIDMKARDYSHYSTGLVYAPVVAILWYQHSFMPSGSTPYLWLGVPKIFMSAILSHMYKGTAEKITYCSTRACRFGISGLTFLMTGLGLNYLGKQHYLPKLDGLTASLTGRIGKVAGYGLADYLTETERAQQNDALIACADNYVMLLQLTRLIDRIPAKGALSYIAPSLRRGLIVRTGLVIVETKVLLYSRAILHAFQLVRELSDTEVVSEQQVQHFYLSGSEDIAELLERCFALPVAGAATQLYEVTCPAVHLTVSNDGTLDSFASTLLAIFLLHNIHAFSH